MPLAENLEPFVAGGLSAMLGSTVIHPADLVKVRQQVAIGKVKGPVAMAIDIVKMEGVQGLYRGLSASLVRQATYGTARIGLHRAISDRLVELNGGSSIPFWQKAGSGMLSGAMAVCIGSPFDISLVRMQTNSTLPVAERRNYRNVFDALIRISREEGPIRLWRGLGPNVLRGMAMNAGMMASYDQAKEFVTTNVTGNPTSLSTSLASSAIAGFCCAFASQPFDLLKSRLMNMKIDPVTKQMPYTGIVDCVTKTIRQEGPMAFMKGFPAYYARCAPHAMVILLSNESITRAYRRIWGIDSTKRHDMVTASRFHSAGTVPNVLHSNQQDDEEGFSVMEDNDDE